MRSIDERPNYSPLSNVVWGTTLGIPDTTLPGQIRDLQAVNPTNNSINLTWTAPADNGSNISTGPVNAYEIRYYSSQIINATWNLATVYPNSITPATPGTTENYRVSSMQPETTYYFAIKSVDRWPNWGWISNSAFNTTLPDPDLIDPEPIINLTAITIDNTTINLTWSATGDDGMIGNASFYDIRYSTSTITALTWPSITQCANEPTPQPPGSTEYYQVTGLLENTTYYFAIKVGDEVLRWSVLSNIASNKTLPTVDLIPPGGITDLAADQPTSTSVRLTWTAPGDEGTIGLVAGYDIRYSTTEITDLLWSLATQCPDWPTPVAPGNTQEYNVTGLLSDQKYYFAVKAFDEQPNYSPLSNVVNATTLVSTDVLSPGVIDDLTATAKSENSIKLTWTAPGDDGDSGTVTGYDIRYSTSQINGSIWDNATQCTNEPLPQISGSDENFTVTGLFASTRYYFAIKSFDERPNYSDLSNIASATTYASDDTISPDRINDLTVVESTETTLTLRWTAPGDDGDSGTATVYDLRFETSTITTTSWQFTNKIIDLPTPKAPGESETYLVTGLDQDTTYYFAIKAGDEVPNWSPLSNIASGTTLGVPKPELSIIFTPEKLVLNSSESMDLGIKVISLFDNQGVPETRINLSSDYPTLGFSTVSGLTNQNGISSFGITAPLVSSKTDITIYAEAIKVGFRSNNSQLIISVQPPVEIPKFNLHISEEDIAFSKLEIIEGEIITIYANISNVGDRESVGFTVTFFLDNQKMAEGVLFESLTSGGFLIVDKSWLALVGNHTIRVEITPTDTTLESNTNDNSAEITFSVKSKEIEIDGDKKKRDDGSGTTFLMLLAIIIIIIVVLLVLFLFLRKRKQEPSETPPPSLPPEEAPQEAPQEVPQEVPKEPLPSEQMITPEQSISEEISAPVQEDFTIIEEPPDVPDTTTETLPGETTETTSAEEPQGDYELVLEEEPVFDVQPETGEISQEPVEVPEQELIAAPTSGVGLVTEPMIETQPIPEPEPTVEPEVTPSAEQSEVQMVACPICEQNISLYSNPCPYCGAELNWE